jgi:transcriptional regulator with XRE-family HTH domain
MERKATYIRAWRAERGYSLDDMVGRLAVLGVDTTGASLSRIERGIQPYNQDMLEAIAAALDVPVSYLIERNPAIPPAKVYDLLAHLNKDEADQAEKVLRAMFGDRAG